MFKTMLTLTVFALLFGQSCASKKTSEQDPTTTKFVYSLMTKDSVALESLFNSKLKRSLKGDMLLKAIKSVGKGEMSGIELKSATDNMAFYDIKTKGASVPLKVLFDKNNKIENIWINKKALGR